jgi:hypothetical protein
MKRLLIWVGIGLVLLGCESTREFDEGDLYVVNNAGERSCLPFHGAGANLEDLYLYVIWEGEWIKVQPNMDEDKNSTGVGAVRITSEPLAGGLSVDFTYRFYYVGDEMQRTLSDVLEEEALVDGDITIELYSENWTPTSNQIVVLAEVHRGKFDGIHMY